MEIKKDFELGKEFTFDNAKKLPIYNWFYYKEGFSPFVVDKLLKYKKQDFEELIDPFCGVGTSLLRSKELGIRSIGIDISPLAAFVSRVKTRDYEDVEKIRKETEKFKNMDKESYRWRFELFPPERAFPKSNYEFITKARAFIESIEEEETRDFFLLALLSIIPQTSYVIKDGGVLRINKRKPTLKAEKLFFRKLKRMIKDLEKAKKGNVPEVRQGNAKEDLQGVKKGIVITSPPYVNAVDYTKVYGLELSLLAGYEGIKIRKQMISSSIYKKMPPTGEFIEYSSLPIVQHYLIDMKKFIENSRKKELELFLVVSNALIHNTHIEIDVELAKIMEELGYKSEIIVGKIRKTRISRVVASVRESAVHGWLE